QNGDNVIGGQEGISTPSPRSIIFFKDGIRQTAADLMQLVRVIQVGVDLEGDGQIDLDPSRVYYFGHSLGGNYGTVFLGVEPDVKAGVFNAPGNPAANRQLGVGGRQTLGTQLQSRTPPLLNPPGITVFGGRDIGAPHFNENLPLRDGLPLPVRLA